MTRHAATRGAASRAGNAVLLVRLALWAAAAILVVYDLIQVVDLSRIAALQALTQQKLVECIEIERTEKKRERPPAYLAPEQLEAVSP